MKTIGILLYKTPWKLKLKYWVNWLISIRTLSKYSHIEIWTPDEDGKFKDCVAGELTITTDAIGSIIKSYQPRDVFVGTCWTATMRGDDNGTVKRDASLVLDHPENWDVMYIQVTDEQYERLITWMDIQVANNKGYAKRDLWKFIIGGLHKPDNKRNICSEFVNNALYIIRLFKQWGIVSPQKVFKKLTALGHKAEPLKG